MGVGMFSYDFESWRDRIQWYARQLLPLKYSWEGEIRMPGEARWTKAKCEWRMWLGHVLWVDWQYTEN